MKLEVGMKNTVNITVTDEMCADYFDRNQLPDLDLPHVLSTPQMINLMELTCAQLMNNNLDEDMRSVGMSVEVKHLSATPAGGKVRCEAEVAEVDGKKVVFAVQTFDENGLIGSGIHRRAAIRKS